MASPTTPSLGSCVLCGARRSIRDACASYAVCRTCGLVRRTGEPSASAPSTGETAWARASIGLRLGRLRAGQAVLVIDGGPGLCAALEDLAGVSATDYPPTDASLASFDALLMFDRLERVAHPTGLLEHSLRWLKPNGRVVVEVSNLELPTGPLRDGLLDGSRAHVLDPFTAREMLLRAGVDVDRVDADERLLVAGEYRPGPTRATSIVPRGEHVAACLDGYRHLERLRREVLSSRSPGEHMGLIGTILERPTFAPHAARVVRELEHLLTRASAHRLGLALCEAVLRGDTPAALRQHCHRAAFLHRVKLGISEPAVVNTAA